MVLRSIVCQTLVLLYILLFVHAGKNEVFEEMPWVHGTPHIALITTKSGIRILEVEMGDPHGAPAIKGDLVSVKTKLFSTTEDGWMKGKHIYSNSSDEEVMTIALGQKNSHALPGLEEGVFKMRLNAKRKLVLPPNLAYGENGDLDLGVDPNAKVLLYVEVVDLKKPPQGDALGKQVGDGYVFPKATERKHQKLDFSQSLPSQGGFKPFTAEDLLKVEQEKHATDPHMQVQRQQQAAAMKLQQAMERNEGKQPKNEKEEKRRSRRDKLAAKGSRGRDEL